MDSIFGILKTKQDNYYKLAKTSDKAEENLAKLYRKYDNLEQHSEEIQKTSINCQKLKASSVEAKENYKSFVVFLT